MTAPIQHPLSEEGVADVLARATLQSGQPPKDRVFYARHHVALKWTPYKPNSQEVKRGKMGRWQQLRPYGIGWQNAETQPQAGAWVEDVINNPHLSGLDPNLLAILERVVLFAPDACTDQFAAAINIARAAIKRARQQEQSHEA